MSTLTSPAAPKTRHFPRGLQSGPAPSRLYLALRWLCWLAFLPIDQTYWRWRYARLARRTGLAAASATVTAGFPPLSFRWFWRQAGTTLRIVEQPDAEPL